MSRLNQLRIVDPVLTNLALGYTNAEMVGAYLLPVANVDKEAGILPEFGNDAFLAYQTERAIRADSNRAELDAPTSKRYVLTEHDIEFAVDDREEAESAFSARRRAMYRAQEAIRMTHERQVAEMTQTLATYATSNRIELSGSTSFANANSDPEGVIDDAKAAISAGIVKDPNVMVIAYDVWQKLKRHPKLKAILSTNRSRLVQMADLQEIFEVPNIYIGRAMRKHATTGVVSRIWAGSIVLAYVPEPLTAAPAAGEVVDPGAMQDVGNPAFGYTFRKRGGLKVDVRRASNDKMDLVRSTDIMAPYLCAPNAGYLIKDALA